MVELVPGVEVRISISRGLIGRAEVVGPTDSVEVPELLLAEVIGGNTTVEFIAGVGV